MPSLKKPPTPNLSTLLKKLNEAAVEFILVGGLAAVAQGAPITTFDLDIVHRRSDKNISRLYRLLASIDACYRRPDEKIIRPLEEDLKGRGHLLLMTSFGPLDILAVIEKGMGYQELLPFSVEITFHGYKMRVLHLETMIELKHDSSRPMDKYRLRIYEETLRMKNGR